MSDNKTEAFAKLPVQSEPLFRGDERITPYLGDVVMSGDPDVVIRARDDQEISEILRYCHNKQIPVTFSGGHTGLTGASATEEGVIIATEHRGRVLDIGRSDGKPFVRAEPGILLGDLKAQVSEAGLFYPPDPTSYKEACLGGTIATNATGEDSLLYGPTRCYIRELKIIRADGEVRSLVRPADDHVPRRKGTAGYVRPELPIDLVIGSEGTLAYIAEVTLDLLSDPSEWWAAIGFFTDMESALEFSLGSVNSEAVHPRALELLDRSSLEIMATAQGIPPLPEEAQAAIYWKQNFQNDHEKEMGINAWYSLFLSLQGEQDASDAGGDIWFAQTDKDKDKFRQWRHHIPATINERVNSFREAGGGKVASDWWVPVKYIQKALQETRRESEQAGLEPIIFGHIGDGHPHVNYRAQTADQRAQAMELIHRQCVRAVQWGGGVAGEHGLGKLYRDHLRIQCSEKEIAEMIRIKKEWDPHWILGRGTLFAVPE